mgnify:CR=1 FL=1
MLVRTIANEVGAIYLVVVLFAPATREFKSALVYYVDVVGGVTLVEYFVVDAVLIQIKALDQLLQIKHT